MAHYSFHKDLEESQIAVGMVKTFLEAKGHEVTELEGKKEQIRGDLEYSDPQASAKHAGVASVEIKYDLMSEKTGNLCFEIYNGSGRPTGILRTMADEIYYVIKREGKHKIVGFGAQTLRDWIFNPKHYNKSRLVSGGDGGKYKMLIVKEVDIIEEAAFIHEV